jgi:hypothetical protein
MTKRANGEGTIWHKPDGRWCGTTYARINTGGRKRVYVYGRTRAEAREKLTALQRGIDRGLTVPAESWTVEQYLRHWLATVVKPNRMPRHIRATNSPSESTSSLTSGGEDFAGCRWRMCAISSRS